MRFRHTLILLAILIGLAAYVLLVERKRPAPEEGDVTPPATPLTLVLSYQPGDARALRLSLPALDQRTTLERDDAGEWSITQPVIEEADQGKVTRLVESLSALRPSRVLTGTVGEPAQYDLDPPLMVVEIEMKDGFARVLKLGARNPSQSGYYGQISGDERIYLMPSSIGSDVERYLDEPPVKPTPTVEATATSPPVILPLPSATSSS